jgi:hypothetical protein
LAVSPQDEEEWDDRLGTAGSLSCPPPSFAFRGSPVPRANSPPATWQPFFATPLTQSLYADKDAPTPQSTLGPVDALAVVKANLQAHSKGAHEEASPSQLEVLHAPVAERHESFFKEPSKRAPTLPEKVQAVMASAAERMEKLNDELQSLAISMQDRSLGVMQAEKEKDEKKRRVPVAELKEWLGLREQEAATLREQLAVRQEQVMALEEALVQALMMNAFVQPQVRTEVRERVVPLKQEVPKYIEKVDEVPVPVFTEVEKIKEIPVETVRTVEVPYEVQKTVEVPRELLREMPLVHHRMVEVPCEEITKEKIVTVENKVPVSVEVIKEVVVDRPVPLELVKEVPITVETPKEINVETRCEVEVIKEVVKEVPHQLVKEVPVPCQVTVSALCRLASSSAFSRYEPSPASLFFLLLHAFCARLSAFY